MYLDPSHLVLGDLNIHGFRYMLGPGTNPPTDTKGLLKFWESQKLFADFQI